MGLWRVFLVVDGGTTPLGGVESARRPNQWVNTQSYSEHSRGGLGAAREVALSRKAKRCMSVVQTSGCGAGALPPHYSVGDRMR